MKAFLIGLLFLFVLGFLLYAGIILFPFLMLLVLFLRILIVLALAVFSIWLLGKIVILFFEEFHGGKAGKRDEQKGGTMTEKEIGVISHYFGKVSVGIIALNDTLKAGETIHIKGAHDDFMQKVESMQIEHVDVQEAKKGDAVGIKVTHPVHEHDKVFKIAV
jgi:putative protease